MEYIPTWRRAKKRIASAVIGIVMLSWMIEGLAATSEMIVCILAMYLAYKILTKEVIG